jgi:hypothetical protein
VWLDGELKRRLNKNMRRTALFFSAEGVDGDDQPDMCWSHSVQMAVSAQSNIGSNKGQMTVKKDAAARFAALQHPNGHEGNQSMHFKFGNEAKGLPPYALLNRAVIAHACANDWSIGRLIALDMKCKRLGLEWSHLCGTSDCIRYSHGHWETSNVNQGRIVPHSKVTTTNIPAMLVQCLHYPPCMMAARAATKAWASYKQLFSDFVARVKRVNDVEGNDGTRAH